MTGTLRQRELEAMVKRMNILAGVFEGRVESIEDRSFRAFRELMDVYVQICRETLAEDRDFVEDELVITTENRVAVAEAFRRIFREAPTAFSMDAPAGGRKG